MNLPNLITIIRILLMPVYLYFFYSDMDNSFLYAGIVFLIAGISDFLDGYIARKYELKTKLGTVLDPLADKIVVFTILISYTHKGLIPSWVLLVMGLKEIVMIIGGGILYISDIKTVIPSNIFGKSATLLFYIAIFSGVLRVPVGLFKFLIVATVILNVLAFINYLIIFLKMEGENKK